MWVDAYSHEYIPSHHCSQGALHPALLSPEQSQCSWARGGFPTVHPQQAKLVLLECQLDRVAFMLRTSSICPFLSEENPKLLLAMPSGWTLAPHSALTRFPPPPPPLLLILHTHRVRSLLRAFAPTNGPSHFFSYPRGHPSKLHSLFCHFKIVSI